MTKHTPGPVPPFPKAIYGCDSCISQSSIEGNSHPPEDLVMITNPPKSWDPGWYCLPCADEVLYQNSQTQIGETLEHYLGLDRDRLKALNAEMLAALNSAVSEMRDWHPNHPSMAQILEAIAKAEGSD